AQRGPKHDHIGNGVGRADGDRGAGAQAVTLPGGEGAVYLAVQLAVVELLSILDGRRMLGPVLRLPRQQLRQGAQWGLPRDWMNGCRSHGESTSVSSFSGPQVSRFGAMESMRRCRRNNP